MPAAAVTPAGVRDGDPAALAGLCAARGPSVLAYCRQLVGDADAAEAAAEAFARFRATVVAAGALSDLNPEAVLVKATREAAASRAARGGEGTCAELPQLLAARANKTISDADCKRLEEHLETCWACRAPVARFKAAERAYGDPPDRTIDPADTALIVAALAAAAPARGAERAPNGAEKRARRAGKDKGAGKPEAAGTGDEPTTKFRMLGTIGGDSGGGDAPVKPAGPLVPPGPVASILALLGLKGIGAPKPGSARPPRTRGPAREGLAGRVATGIPRSRAGTPTATPLRGSPRGRGRPRPPLRLPIVLPIALVLIALIVALSVSGVFGGSDPASSPSVAVPAEQSADSPPAEVVNVPGAKDASGDAVELAKARDRARARRQREAASKRKSKPSAAKKKTPATTPPADATTPPPAVAATPPPAAPPPPPPPPPASNTSNGSGGATKSGSRKIEAGKGATGSEQIPPVQDTSNVPDLAPPPETATNP